MAKFNLLFICVLFCVICHVSFVHATQISKENAEDETEAIGSSHHAMPIPDFKFPGFLGIPPTPNITQSMGIEELKRLSHYAIEWCHNNALILRKKGDKGRSDAAEFPPITLFPTPYPRKTFEQALKVQEAMNLLYFRVARDHEFLMNAYKDVIKSDKFIAKLVNIVKEVHEEGIRQPITVMLQRADYLLNVVENNNETNKIDYEPKQVEVNTGAIGATGLKRRTTDLHRRMMKLAGYNPTTPNMPDNKPDAALIETFYRAWRIFNDPNAIMVCLVYSDTPFMYDSRYIEDELDKKSGGKMKVEYYSLVLPSERGNSTKRLQLDPADFSLRLDGKRVAIVYSGQSALGSPMDDVGIEFRQIIERSTAIKAPSLAVAISSSKKVQQLLAKPGTLEHFFPEEKDAETVAQIRATFANLWGLENQDENTEKLIQDAMANPGNYVLKPNKECGGHNFYDEQLVEKLKEFTPTERAAHILMQKLKSKTEKNYVLRPHVEPEMAEVIPELGVYGFLIGDLKTGRVLHNVQQGYHFRTKLSHVNEAGISAGFGYYDTAYLY